VIGEIDAGAWNRVMAKINGEGAVERMAETERQANALVDALSRNTELVSDHICDSDDCLAA
jgi:regulator of extracellular matrix RemA (YlzA/DUF370 family)